MKENQRITLTKRLLQEALFRLLEHTPLDKISITQLCNEAEINRATFYRHYETPSDILLQMQMDFDHQLRQRHPAENIHNFPQYAEAFLADLYEHADQIKVFLKNNTSDDLLHFINQTFELFLTQYTLGTTLDADSLKLLAAFTTGGSYHMLKQWLLGEIEKTPKEMANMITKVLQYIATKQIFPQ